MPLLLLFVVFILLPLAELYVIIQVGQAIGILPTLALLLLDGFVGASVARSQGRQAWRRFNEAMAAGKVPAKEVADGAMIVFGGALLLSPGFLTDILGFALLLPPGRAVIRGLMKRAAAKTPAGRPVFFVYDRYGARSGSGRGSGKGASDFDVDGTAREVGPDERELPRGEGEDEGRGDRR